jgi:hypothetical protein
MPQMDTLSADRWTIWQLKKEQRVDWFHNESHEEVVVKLIRNE